MPLVAEGASVLALGEMAGDKMRWAPDRTVAPGLAGRVLTGGLAGTVLSSARDRRLGAFVGAAAAVASSYATLALRSRLSARFGQRPTGLAEDALVAIAALWIARNALGSRAGR